MGKKQDCERGVGPCPPGIAAQAWDALVEWAAQQGEDVYNWLAGMPKQQFGGADGEIPPPAQHLKQGRRESPSEEMERKKHWEHAKDAH